MTQHWFWFFIMLTCIVWYSTITIYIAIKGAADIKHMLQALEKLNHPDHAEGPGVNESDRIKTNVEH